MVELDGSSPSAKRHHIRRSGTVHRQQKRIKRAFQPRLPIEFPAMLPSLSQWPEVFSWGSLIQTSLLPDITFFCVRAPGTGGKCWTAARARTVICPAKKRRVLSLPRRARNETARVRAPRACWDEHVWRGRARRARQVLRSGWTLSGTCMLWGFCATKSTGNSYSQWWLYVVYQALRPKSLRSLPRGV